MQKKRTYFISLDKNKILQVSVPDTVEYEVSVTEEELEEIRSLMKTYKHRDFEFITKNVLLKPFAEEEVDEMRKNDDDNLMLVYAFIYQHGTEKTKEMIIEMGYNPI